MKTCPYCQQILPFWNTVKQRIFPTEGNLIKCGHCDSVISDSTGAGIPLLVGGSSGLGILAGKLVAIFFSWNLVSIFAGIITGIIIFLIAAYVLAPIREA